MTIACFKPKLDCSVGGLEVLGAWWRIWDHHSRTYVIFGPRAGLRLVA